MQLKHKRKGRKLFTTKDRNHRIFHRYHPMRSALGIALTAALAAVLGIVGYNVIGPLVTRLSAEAESPTKTDDPFFEQETEPVKTEASVTGTAGSDTTASRTTTATAAATTEITLHTSKFGENVTYAYCITPETFSDLKLLETAADRCAAQGCTALILPMKLSGGQLLYASAVPDAVSCGASAASPSPEAVKAVLDAHGLKGIAQLNLLTDHLFPAEFSDGGFLIPDSQTRWLDRAESDGGKPWMSPYSAHAASYLSALASELISAGFQNVLCYDIAFPKFFNSDEALLGKQITDAKRRADGLTGLMNKIAENVPEAVFSFSLSDAINKKAEALVPEQMTVPAVSLTIDLSAFRSPFIFGDKRYALSGKTEAEMTTELLGISRQLLGDIRLIPCFVRGNLTDEQLNTVLETAIQAGYTEVYAVD